jgi:NADH-quinone oxidoreductase subunit C
MGNLDRDRLREKLRDFDVEIANRFDGEFRLTVEAAKALALLGRLRDDPNLSMRRLVDLTAVDRGGNLRRFEIVYRLHSPALDARLRVHVLLDGAEPALDSVVEIWPAANWLEREVFDLFGIQFTSHPDLRRILLEADFEGAPLRKDYPRQPNLALPKEAER